MDARVKGDGFRPPITWYSTLVITIRRYNSPFHPLGPALIQRAAATIAARRQTRPTTDNLKQMMGWALSASSLR